MHILLIEDDPATQAMLKQVLIDNHYEITVTGNGRSGLELVREFAYDLILLDINIPELDGISLCKLLRSEQCEIPILLLTAKDKVFDRIIGLDAGADDYAVKPFNVEELLARIRALLRRNQPRIDRNIASWNRLELNSLTNEVRYDDRILRLTSKEYGILELLLLNPDRIFSRSTLISKLWELETAPTESVINSHVKSIRHKLKLAGATIDPIETIYGFGYRLRRTESTIALAPTASQVEIESAIVNESILELWGQFKDAFRAQIEVLETSIRSYAATFPTSDPELGATVRQIAHQLAGSLGVYGFPQGSILARQIADLFNADLQLTMLDLQWMMQLVVDLQAEISQEPAVGEAFRDEAPGSDRLLTGTVMVVDKDPTILDRLSAELTVWGLEAISIIDLQDFWAQLDRADPDLLILEIEMPESSGIKLCQTIRNNPRWHNLPIIFISASSHSATILQAFAVGANDYMCKPLQGFEAIARIINQLEPRAIHRQYLISQILRRVYESGNSREDRSSANDFNC